MILLDSLEHSVSSRAHERGIEGWRRARACAERVKERQGAVPWGEKMEPEIIFSFHNR